MSEKEKYLNWCEEQQKNGLRDIKFFINDDEAHGASEEEFYSEANEIVRLYKNDKALPRPDVI